MVETVNIARRMTDAELAVAADALLPASPSMPPMEVPDLLSYFTVRTRELQADLWTLRDALDVHTAGDTHSAGVCALALLASLYDDATNVVRNLAADLNIPLPPDHYGPASC
jgi:hypothetical protein